MNLNNCSYYGMNIIGTVSTVVFVGTVIIVGTVVIWVPWQL